MNAQVNLGRESTTQHMPGYRPSYRNRRKNSVQFQQPTENKWHQPSANVTAGLGGGGFRSTKRYDFD